ncbi:MAG TPA: phage holin family protein [Thermoanaerobaculia bacterium]|nr:phage holin family protein [Thermoanaerobaculia bacterium]
MAIVQALVAFIGRSFGKILSALFDWAVVAIFGFASGTEKIFLSALLAAAGAWPLLLLGIAAPKVATFLLAFVPIPSWIPSSVVRWFWIGLALTVPLAVGAAMAARQPPDRPRRSWPARLLRGFPITAGLSAALLITLVTVPALRLASAARRRKDVQVPLLTDAASYQRVARRILTVLDEHGRTVRRAPPPWWLTAPLRVLGAVDRDAFESRIPADLAYFEGRELVLALYPSGLLIRGRQDALASAQGLIVEGVSDLDVWQTSEPRAQEIERRIARLWHTARGDATEPSGPAPDAALLEIARAIEALAVDYDEWQIVYRKALQLSRELDGEPQLLAGLTHKEETMERYEERGRRSRLSGNNGGPTTRRLVGEIGSQIMQLVQTEVELARAELASDMRSGRRLLVGLGVAAAAALVGITLLLVAVVLALGTLMPGWVAALLVAALVLGVGATIGYLSWQQRPSSPLALTRKSLKEDWEWLKEQVG